MPPAFDYSSVLIVVDFKMLVEVDFEPVKGVGKLSWSGNDAAGPNRSERSGNLFLWLDKGETDKSFA